MLGNKHYSIRCQKYFVCYFETIACFLWCLQTLRFSIVQKTLPSLDSKEKCGEIVD